MVVVRLLGVRKSVEDQLCYILCLKLGGNDVWTLVLVASYWLQVVTWSARLPRDSAWIFPHRCFYSIGRGRCPFRLAIPLSGQLLWGSCGTPHNEFLGKSQLLPTIEAVGTYVLKDCKID